MKQLSTLTTVTHTNTLRLRSWFHQVLQNVRINYNTDNRVLAENLGI